MDVSPYEYAPGSEEESTTDGNVQIRVTHLTSKPSDMDATWTDIDRLEALGGDASVPTVAPEEDADDIDLVVPVDDSALPDTKKDFDGNVVSQG